MRKCWLVHAAHPQYIKPVLPLVTPVLSASECPLLFLTLMPRRLSRLSRVCGYAAAVGSRRGHGTASLTERQIILTRMIQHHLLRGGIRANA